MPDGPSVIDIIYSLADDVVLGGWSRGPIARSVRPVCASSDGFLVEKPVDFFGCSLDAIPDALGSASVIDPRFIPGPDTPGGCCITEWCPICPVADIPGLSLIFPADRNGWDSPLEALADGGDTHRCFGFVHRTGHQHE